MYSEALTVARCISVFGIKQGIVYKNRALFKLVGDSVTEHDEVDPFFESDILCVHIYVQKQRRIKN